MNLNNLIITLVVRPFQNIPLLTRMLDIRWRILMEDLINRVKCQRSVREMCGDFPLSTMLRRLSLSEMFRRLLVLIFKTVDRLLDYGFSISLYTGVIFTSLLMSTSVVSFWIFFMLSNYLHPIIRALFIWGMTFIVIILAATVDYLKTGAYR